MAPTKNLQGLLKKTATKRAERVQDLHLDLPVPTWNGDLVMRFGVLDREIIDKIEGNRRTVEQDYDMLVGGLESLWVYGPESDMRKAGLPDDEIEAVTRMKENENYFKLEDENGLPIKWDVRLLDAFYDEEEPDEIIVEVKKDPQVSNIILWAFKGNATAVGETTGRLLVWSANTDRDVNDGLLPESRA